MAVRDQRSYDTVSGQRRIRNARPLGLVASPLMGTEQMICSAKLRLLAALRITVHS